MSGDWLGAFLLDKCMSKTFLSVVCGPPVAVNVVSNFVNKDIVKIEVADGITVVPAKFKRMSAEKNTLAPVEAIAPKRTAPGSLLLSCAGQKKNSTQSEKVLGRHPL